MIDPGISLSHLSTSSMRLIQQARCINLIARKAMEFGQTIIGVVGVVGVGMGVYYYFRNQRKIMKRSKWTMSYFNIYHTINQMFKNARLQFLVAQWTKRMEGKKYSVDIGYFPSLINKPVANAPEVPKKNPFLPPFEEGLHVMDLGDRHRLIFNKFPIHKNHMLIISKEFEEQTSFLSREDFKQTLVVMNSLNGVYFFNSGKDSGGSQPHKHLQCLPSAFKESLILSQLLIYVGQKYRERNNIHKIIKFPNFNFVHGMILLNPQWDLQDLATKTHKAYQTLYQQFVPCQNKDSKISYNLLGTERFLLLIPRRKQRSYDLTDLNAMAFAGSLMTRSIDNYNKLIKYQPEQILEDVTFADEDQLAQYKKQIKN